MMWDIFFVILMVFLSGVSFGLGTVIIVEFYNNKRWKKWKKEQEDADYCPNCGAKMVDPQETETWNGYHGQITAPKGTFEKIYEDAESEDEE